MRLIEKALEPTTGYIISFERNPLEGWWEAKVGLPKSWVYHETDDVKCEVLEETENGKLINVMPTDPEIVIDDIIMFIETIIKINNEIHEKEQAFKSEMDEVKTMLQEKAEKFYNELDVLKKSSFNNALNKNDTNQEDPDLLIMDGKPTTIPPKKTTQKKRTKPVKKKTTTKKTSENEEIELQ